MPKQIRFRFTRRWEDLDGVFEKGSEITLSAKEVEVVKERMRIWGKTADLCKYANPNARLRLSGLYLVPLSRLERL